jgi:hypothetical protein
VSYAQIPLPEQIHQPCAPTRDSVTFTTMQYESLRVLYPALTEEELRIVAENLDRYLEVAWEISQELRDSQSPD